MRVYHGTSARHRAAIKRNGLQPRRTVLNRVGFKNTFGRGAFVTTDLRIARLFANESVALEAFEAMSIRERDRLFAAIRAQACGERVAGVPGTGLVVTLDVPADELIPDPAYAAAPDRPAYYSAGGFPPSAIRELNEFDPTCTLDPSLVLWCWAGDRAINAPGDPHAQRAFEWLASVFGTYPVQYPLEEGRPYVSPRARDRHSLRRVRPRPLGFPDPDADWL